MGGIVYNKASEEIPFKRTIKPEEKEVLDYISAELGISHPVLNKAFVMVVVAIICHYGEKGCSAGDFRELIPKHKE